MNVKRICCIAFLATTVLAQSPTKTSQPTTENTAGKRPSQAQQLPFADARNMTVIVTYAPGGAVPRPSGSGVWVGQHGYVLTCWHVVMSSPTDWRIVVPRPSYVIEGPVSVTDMSTMIQTELVAYDKDTDLAILKANQTPAEAGIPQQIWIPGPNWPPSLIPQTPISPKGATLQTEFPTAGDIMLLAGFPLGQQSLILQTGVATGFYTKQPTPQTPPKKALRIMLSLVSNPGNSGGPVLDAEGKVIGLLEGNLLSPMRDTQGRELTCLAARLNPATGQPMRDGSGNPIPDFTPCAQNSGISIAVPSKFIAELAEKNHIKLD
jgi:S1-C subfamily serine protease